MFFLSINLWANTDQRFCKASASMADTLLYYYSSQIQDLGTVINSDTHTYNLKRIQKSFLKELFQEWPRATLKN